MAKKNKKSIKNIIIGNITLRNVEKEPYESLTHKNYNRYEFDLYIGNRKIIRDIEIKKNISEVKKEIVERIYKTINTDDNYFGYLIKKKK